MPTFGRSVRGLAMRGAHERRFQPVQLDLVALTGLVQPLFRGRNVESARLIAAGRCNSNYRLIISGYDDPVLLRIYVRDPGACAREARLHSLLKGQIPLAEHLYAHTEQTSGGWTYALFSCVEGQRMDEWLHSAEPEDAASLGRELGFIHARIASRQFDSAGLFGPGLEIAHPFDNVVDAWLLHLEACLAGRAGERLGERLSAQVRAFVSEHRSQLDSERDARSLIHCDFRPENLLVCPGPNGWTVAAVLDWEFASAGSRLADAGQFFREEDLLPPTFEREFEQGCAEAGLALPPDWRLKGLVLDLVHLCDLLATDEDRPVTFLHVRHLIAETLASQGRV